MRASRRLLPPANANFASSKLEVTGNSAITRRKAASAAPRPDRHVDERSVSRELGRDPGQVRGRRPEDGPEVAMVRREVPHGTYLRHVRVEREVGVDRSATHQRLPFAVSSSRRARRRTRASRARRHSTSSHAWSVTMADGAAASARQCAAWPSRCPTAWTSCSAEPRPIRPAMGSTAVASSSSALWRSSITGSQRAGQNRCARRPRGFRRARGASLSRGTCG